MDKVNKRSIQFFVLLAALFLVTSCYSVRLRTVNGVGMPDPVSERTDYYRDFKVVEVDTVITIGALDKDFTYLIKNSDGLFIVEYRNTFGGLLLSAITLGRKRQVKIKYVSLKPEN